jgi:hypothetical protein
LGTAQALAFVTLESKTCTVNVMVWKSLRPQGLLRFTLAIAAGYGV